MIPELGHYALILALCMALVQTIYPLVGAGRGNLAWMRVARPVAWGQFTFVAIAFACLTYAFVTHDFSVLYVANNSNSELPLVYRISAVWGAHEGSLLLWSFILSLWTVAVCIFSRSLPRIMVARVIGIMGFISIGFLLFMLLTSSPFERLFPPAMEGRDLNPLLQDPGLAIHPPMLYVGYVGFSVAFAFAIAALLSGKLDAAWTRWTRPWTLAAWLFLTTGITLGSWWAYYELGWGGWWFWDPVENASFMPWLAGTALIHSLAVTEKRGAFKNWTLLLAIIAFSLSLLGTFLVRSGVLVSVHAFANDPERGLFILMFLGLVVGGSLLLYAWRAPNIQKTGDFQFSSRETFLLTNNVLLIVAMVTILIGTVYPLIHSALGWGSLSVGKPYFDMMFILFMAPLIFVMGIGPNVRWKQQDPYQLLKQLRYVFLASIFLSLLLIFVIMGNIPPMVILGIALAFWLVLTLLSDVRNKLTSKQSKWQGLRSMPLSYYGMLLAHIGIAVTVIGITVSSYYSVEKDIRIEPGETITLAGHHFQFLGVQQTQGPNYIANRGTLRVTKGDEEIVVLQPEKRVYRVQQNPMTEAAIDAGLFRDIYVALGEPLPDGNAWAVRIYYKPFIRWIWLGAIFMAIGGFLAATDRRYRVLSRHKKKSLAQSPGADPAIVQN